MMRYFVLLLLPVLFTASCKSDKDTKPVSPAGQSHPVKEGDLNTITLTAKAQERLGIKIVEAVDQLVDNSRYFSGEVMAIPGRTVTVTAPVPGTLVATRNGNMLQPGQPVIKGQAIGQLMILPSEKDMLSVQADIDRLETQVMVATEKLKRAALLYEEKAGSLRVKQDAEAELASLDAQLRVAKNRLEVLRGNTTQQLVDKMSTLVLESPVTGVLQRIYSNPLQVLAAAAPVADIASLQTLWIRVPVYAGDYEKIQTGSGALVKDLSAGTASGNAVAARPVTGLQTSDPLATSVDLYYEIDNPSGKFRPGQRVNVTIPYRGGSSGLVVPFTAILYDIQGGAWVYENTAPLTYIRRRVEVLRVTNGMAVLQRGIPAGTKVVTDGAAELFGTEFGGGK